MVSIRVEREPDLVVVVVVTIQVHVREVLQGRTDFARP